MSEPWFCDSGPIEAVPLAPDKPINQTPVSLLTHFNTDHKRYQVYVRYDARSGVGDIRLNVEPFESVE